MTDDMNRLFTGLAWGAPVVFALLAVRARTIGRVWIVWPLAALYIVIVGGVGVAAWRELSIKETPLSSYLLAAILPAVGSSLLVHWSSRGSWNLGSTWRLVALVIAAAIPLVFVGTLAGFFLAGAALTLRR